METKFVLIAAMGRNSVIGNGLKLPWGRLPVDWEWFLGHTINQTLIVGGVTWRAMGAKALPNRFTIVITRHPENIKPADNVLVVGGVEEAILACNGKSRVFICGGQQIYELFLALAEEILLTEIDYEFEGDVFFPDFDRTKWKPVCLAMHRADRVNKYSCKMYSFVRLPVEAKV